jgi:hypothetical protein
MPDIQKVWFTGTLMAELPVDNSTGLSLIGDQQFVIEGKALNSVGIDLGGRDYGEYIGKHLTITGVLQNRGGHETEYFLPVVIAEEIREVSYSGVDTKRLSREDVSISLSIHPAQFSRTSFRPTVTYSLSSKDLNPKTLTFRDPVEVHFTVTQLAGLYGAFKEVWNSDVASQDREKRIAITRDKPLVISTSLPAEAVPEDATYILNAAIRESSQYSLQTQFRVTV